MVQKAYGINDQTVLTIGEFSILWCHFENSFFQSYATPTKVKCWAAQLQPDDQLQCLYLSLRSAAVEYLKCSSEIINQEIISKRIYSNAHQGTPEEIETILDFLTNEKDDRNWVGCMLYIQRIRNNLFHGLKDIYSLNAQNEMFVSINQILHYILNKE